jgi:hypothetical protein
MRGLALQNLTWIGEAVGFGRPTLLSGGDRCDLGPVVGFPGLINSHDHLDFNCYPLSGNPPYADFVAWGTDVQRNKALIAEINAIPTPLRRAFGVLKNLLWGVTAVSDHAEPATATPHPIAVLQNFDFIHSPEGGKRIARILHARSPRPVIAHLAEGITEQSRRRARIFLRRNAQCRPIGGIHGVSLRDNDFSELAALIWCPASNHFLFGRTADINAARRRTAVVFGTDSTISAPGTLWDHLRLARRHASAIQILAALTSAPSRFWRLGANYASNNFVVARRKHTDPLEAFLAIDPADILLVVCRGETALADPAVIEAIPCLATSLERAPNGKFVRMPLPRMKSEVENSVPAFDIEAMLRRFIAPVMLIG